MSQYDVVIIGGGPGGYNAAIRAGQAAGIPVITGTTREEWRLFALMDFEAVDAEVLHRRLDALTGDADKALAVVPPSVMQKRCGAT